MERKLNRINYSIGKIFIRPLTAVCVMALTYPLNSPEIHAANLTISPTFNSQPFSPELFQNNYFPLHFVETVRRNNDLQENPEPLKLENYLSSLQGDQERLRQIVEEKDIFAGFKNFTEQQRVDDFNEYFPIYRAADLKYQVPWSLLWIIHADETTVSRDPGLNQGKQIKGMQIDPNYDQYLAEAPVGWEILSDLPGPRDPNDWEEILKAALYIRNGAEQVKKLYGSELSDEDAILEVVKYRYSAPQYGRARVKQYLKIKPLFDYSR